jgi:SAM-dependent methyltransferase
MAAQVCEGAAMELYDGAFFASVEESARCSARVIVPWLLQRLRPASVVDVGCGAGVWLDEFVRAGVADVLGVDGPWVPPAMRHIPPDRFVVHDLARPLALPRRFDLVVCLEVAEHLPPEAAETLVATLARLGSVVVFSAAVPGQGGTGHLNERPHAWWDRLFAARGFLPWRGFGGALTRPDVAWWYARNLVVYVREGSAALGALAKGEERLAVLVPYRDREMHLKILVPHLTRHLKRAGIPHTLYVVEQADDRPFIRGKLFNIGYRLTADEADYWLQHDVDMICYRDVDYGYPSGPTHLAGAVSQFGYRLPYPSYFGGVTTFNRADFERVNGFSNEYASWGSEDDDILMRVHRTGLQEQRRAGRFESLWHPPCGDVKILVQNNARLREMSEGRVDWRGDGLTNLRFQLLSRQTRSVAGCAYQHCMVVW